MECGNRLQILIETRPALVRESVVKFAYRILRAGPDGAEPKLLAEGGGLPGQRGGSVRAVRKLIGDLNGDVEIASERISSSVTTPPALRMTWASPSVSPRIP